VSDVLRVAMVCPYSLGVPGGVQEQAQGLAGELGRRGHHVTLVSPGRGGASPVVEATSHEMLVGRVRSVPANGSQASLTFSLVAARSSARSIFSSGTDVVHLHEPLAPLLGWPFLAPSASGLVATFHRSGVDGLYRAAGRLLRGRLRAIDVAAAVSPAAASTAHEVLGLDPVVLFNGIDVSAYADAEPWGSQGQTVMFVGRDEPRKGRSVLLDAAERLSSSVTVWATGSPPPGWRQGAGARIEFLGVIADAEKRRRLRSASVLCAPSLGGESFGIILLEAMAAGVPVVCSDIDGYRQALAGCGTLVAPGEPMALADALRDVLVSPPSGTVDDGRRRAREWSMEVLADRYEALYADAASAGRRRRSR
jgi:phosphatidylinositol alpha-mannosyltransferase